MRKILVPTDFSKYAGYAYDLAISIQEKEPAEVHLLHVIEYPVGGTVDPVGLFVPMPTDKDFIRILKDNAKDQMQTFHKPNESRVITRYEMGSPYLQTVEYASKENIDLIIMGTKGATGLKEVFIGSNAERIVRRASCPVITLSQSCDLEGIDSIAFAVNLKETPETVFNQLISMQQLFGAKIHMVHINTPNNFQRDIVSRKYLKNIVEAHKISDVEVHIFNDLYPREGIFTFAESIDADMIIMVTHGRTGFAHFAEGSLTEDIVNRSTLPICALHHH